MALLRVDVISKALDMATSFMAVLPDEGNLQKTRVVYLLHGLTDNCTGWTRYTSCERYAREHGVALIMPEVQRSYYIDGVHGLKYFTYVSQELPQMVHRMFGSFSGVTDLEQMRENPTGSMQPWEYDALLGAGKPTGAENDLFRLAQKKTLPPIYLSCGEQDSLYEMNVRFDAHLKALGANHRFDHRPGDHSWDFWDQSLQDCMDWLKL